MSWFPCFKAPAIDVDSKVDVSGSCNCFHNITCKSSCCCFPFFRRNQSQEEMVQTVVKDVFKDKDDLKTGRISRRQRSRIHKKSSSRVKVRPKI